MTESRVFLDESRRYGSRHVRHDEVEIDKVRRLGGRSARGSIGTRGADSHLDPSGREAPLHYLADDQVMSSDHQYLGHDLGFSRSCRASAAGSRPPPAPWLISAISWATLRAVARPSERWSGAGPPWPRGHRLKQNRASPSRWEAATIRRTRARPCAPRTRRGTTGPLEKDDPLPPSDSERWSSPVLTRERITWGSSVEIHNSERAMEVLRARLDRRLRPGAGAGRRPRRRGHRDGGGPRWSGRHAWPALERAAAAGTKLAARTPATCPGAPGAGHDGRQSEGRRSRSCPPRPPSRRAIGRSRPARRRNGVSFGRVAAEHRNSRSRPVRTWR